MSYERDRRWREERGRQGPSPVVLALIAELALQFNRLPIKPKVTAALLVANIGIYLTDFGRSPSVRRLNCLCAEKILANKLVDMPVNRLLLSGFLHADDMHLYYNMISLMWKGSQLEPDIGTETFALLCLFSLVVSHILYLGICHSLLSFADYSDSYYSCAVGFSAVLFALKYVLNAKSDNMTTVNGITLPLKWAAWAELVLVSVVSKNASFVGHLAGILAGMLWVHVVAPLFTARSRRRM